MIQTHNRSTKQLSYMAMLFSLLIVSAKIFIPLPLLDYLSLQIVVVYLLFPILGLKNGLLVSISYFILGVLGLPIFAAGGGLAYILRPSFGFLLAFAVFPLIQFQMKKSLNDKGTFQSTLLVNYASLIWIHVIGISYKYFILTTSLEDPTPLFAVLTISSLIDFSCDLLLVTFATSLELRLKKVALKIAIVHK
ncbi:biotin transporter BioY [Enterococcus lemanii]|jgi:biotin transport system substrate-specific component|uniref:Biotin transporter n=1 Tax=Enterococcus lemanii TaxID=1159752 RepID=A0ABV9MSQ0_9ENTE|nr:biotin transporter BioY [Enterococcus lemanii]MBM7708470.1 biotin transport system substrate-specific component [Enterococcus lemanii]